MDKDIRQYLHYYLGKARVRHRYVDYEQGVWTVWEKLTIDHYGRLLNDLSIDGIQLELRKLESMTDEEMKELYCDADCWAHCSKADITKIGFDGENTNCICLEYKKKLPNFTSGSHIGSERFYLNSISSQKFHWLISRGFDVFNLINRGAAINKEQQ